MSYVLAGNIFLKVQPIRYYYSFKQIMLFITMSSQQENCDTIILSLYVAAYTRAHLGLISNVPGENILSRLYLHHADLSKRINESIELFLNYGL